MMADLKCGLAVRIISGIFGFLDPGRGRHQMEDSSGDNQAEGADTASARTRNQALCSAIILIHIHIHTLAHSDEHWAGVHSSGLECIYLVKIFY